jgi:NTP pyrophosphatase (non-canonical NTP hydrolase)
MTIENYQEEVKRTLTDLPGVLDNELHMVLGMTTESSEIADVYKKALAYNKPIDYINVKEEIGDLMFYVANMCNLNGWGLKDLLETNINKLRIRYPEKFTEDKAINRDLKSERKILES